MARIWTTDEVDENEQFTYWRDAISNAFVPLEPERGTTSRFIGRIQALDLPVLHLSTITADSHHVELNRHGMARQRGNPFFVNLLRHGSAEIRQNGEQQRAGPGDVYVVDSSAPWSVDFRSSFEMLCVEIDEDMLRSRLGSRGRLTTPVIAGDCGNGAFLAKYLAMIGTLDEAELDGSQHLVLEHCAALLGRANAGSASTPAAEVGHRISLQAVLAFIDAHLTDSELSPQAVCTQLRISRSYLFKVLAAGGHTFENYVRQRRLEGCRATLIEFPEMPVMQIAGNWGFTDASSFSRAFKKAFQMTPSELRAGAMRKR